MAEFYILGKVGKGANARMDMTTAIRSMGGIVHNVLTGGEDVIVADEPPEERIREIWSSANRHFPLVLSVDATNKILENKREWDAMIHGLRKPKALLKDYTWSDKYRAEHYGTAKRLLGECRELREWLMCTSNQKSIFVLWGPTGVGKTSHLKLATKNLGVHCIELEVTEKWTDKTLNMFMKSLSAPQGSAPVLIMEDCDIFNHASDLRDPGKKSKAKGDESSKRISLAKIVQAVPETVKIIITIGSVYCKAIDQIKGGGRQEGQNLVQEEDNEEEDREEGQGTEAKSSHRLAKRDFTACKLERPSSATCFELISSVCMEEGLAGTIGGRLISRLAEERAFDLRRVLNELHFYHGPASVKTAEDRRAAPELDVETPTIYEPYNAAKYTMVCTNKEAERVSVFLEWGNYVVETLYKNYANFVKCNLDIAGASTNCRPISVGRLEMLQCQSMCEISRHISDYDVVYEHYARSMYGGEDDVNTIPCISMAYMGAIGPSLHMNVTDRTYFNTAQEQKYELYTDIDGLPKVSSMKNKRNGKENPIVSINYYTNTYIRYRVKAFNKKSIEAYGYSSGYVGRIKPPDVQYYHKILTAPKNGRKKRMNSGFVELWKLKWCPPPPPPTPPGSEVVAGQKNQNETRQKRKQGPEERPAKKSAVSSASGKSAPRQR